MRIAVTVKPNSRVEGIVAGPDGSLTVRVAAPPAGGKANDRLVELLAKRFGVPKSRVVIVHGTSGRRKLVEIAA